MILKNIFGKTIEAAKKTAYQMYGDDILILESSEASEEGKKARITIFTDGSSESVSAPNPRANKFAQAMKSEEEGVQFERSGVETAQQEQKESPRLLALRKFATEQIIADNQKKNDPSGMSASGNGGQNLPPDEEETEKTSNTVYKRSNIRNIYAKKNNEEVQPKDDGPKTINSKSGSKFITHFRESKSTQEAEPLLPAAGVPREDKRAIKALHKRFDKIEALLDSAIISANLDYASHPAFQQLVQTGINTSTVAGWFSKIIKTGIDPYDQPQLFMAKLGGIIRDSLGKAPVKEPQKFILFAGPSGAGKTSLIMKLCLHPDFMLNKKVGVISVHPQEQSDTYYTILEPFCADNEIPFFAVKKGMDLNDYLEEWKTFDHILIDTPSLNTEDDDSFREYWKIRQVLTPLAPLEVHFVVNAANSRFYFRNKTAKHHPLQPDFIAITHLDEVAQWGPVIPFMKEIDCSARYLSVGNELPTSLQEFNPKWFAQKVLEN
jgi:flagellar biosynthesis GTPase FlhF